ncbi:flavin reductase family protein [Tepidamorphus sp. 3E244]|uniref:flavin reductase family protein n=1 Tax=Tepidamorphus sp. 3E244 TaxID=3385498 RepID=UPI0038FC3BBE
MSARNLATKPAEAEDTATFERFCLAMRELAGGVCVVTSGRGDMRTGLTATSVTSLSAEPPSLLVCIHRASSMLEALRETGAFAVNMLAHDQQAIADRFAGRCGRFGAERYDGAQWRELSTGSSILTGALANLDCRVEQITEWHTHAIVVGSVEAIAEPGGNAPLVYWRGGYSTFAT